MNYQDRVAVVTGAGSGIGRALTLALTDNGAHVAASDIDQEGLAKTQAACRPGKVTTYQVDVADRQRFWRTPKTYGATSDPLRWCSTMPGSI